MGIRRLAFGIAVASVACGIDVVGFSGGASGHAGAPLEDAGGLPAVDGNATGPTSEGGAPSDGAVVDADTPRWPTEPVTIASAGEVTAPTGNAQQTHLVYAENGRRWWLFTINAGATRTVQSWSSRDFITWSQGADLPLSRSHQNLGANFSVAYASIAGRDVVHLGIGLPGTGNVRSHYHARAEITGASIAWSATPIPMISDVDDSLLKGPEGGFTLIGPTGRVSDFTGWVRFNGNGGTGNQNVFRSQSPDLGTSWAAGFPTRGDIELATNTVHARAAVSLGGEEVLAVWEAANAEPDPNNLRSSRFNGTSWSSATDVFADSSFGVNDWGLTALAGGDVHAVRRPAGFQHRRYDGSTWGPGSTIPALPVDAKKHAGLVLLHDATRLFLVTITDSSSIRMTTWSADVWSEWKVVAPAAGDRSALSGWYSPTAGLGLVWTEVASAGNSVAGYRFAP